MIDRPVPLGLKQKLRGPRARLTLVSVGVLAAALVIAGGALIASLAYAQRSDVDAGLAAQAAVVISGIEDLNGSITLPTSEETDTVFGAVSIESAIVGTQGVLSQTTGQPIAALTLTSLAQAARRVGRTWEDVVDVHGAARRALAEPLSGDPAAPVLVISRPVGELDAALRRTAALLGVVWLALLVGGGALSYWLAGRVLDRLEASFESLRRFTADASHELRAPLALLRSELDVTLTRDRSGSEYRRTLSTVRDEVDHLTRLADQLLVLARADAGSLVPRRESVDVADLLHESAARWRPIAHARDVTIDVVAPDSGVLRAEPALIRRVIDNLIDNAIRYSPAAGAVTLRAGPEDGGWWITVRDRGPGIAPEHRPLLFKRFVRPDAARTREQGGSGLGLALSAGVVAAHGGRIELVSGDGPGAQFRFYIPA